MRCGCPECDAYMVHADGPELGCVCPYCGYRCTACLGTNSVLSREDLQRLREDPSLVVRLADDLRLLTREEEEGEDAY